MVDPSVYPYYQRLMQDPDDAEALFVLWQWYGDRHEFQQLATFVEQVASRRLDPASAADLYFRAGELWAKNVGRVDKAVGNYRRAFELDPNQVPAVEAARGIYLQLNNFKLAAQLFERQLGLTADPAARLELLRGLASVRAQMSDPSGQAAALEEVIRLTPDDFEAMRELASAYIARADGPGGGDDDRIRAAALLATIAHGLGDEHMLAFAEYALETWPGDPSAFVLVRDAYNADGRTAELATRSIQFISANPDSELAYSIRLDLARVYEENGQLDDAIVALAPVAEHDEAVARQLCELYRRAGHRAELVRLLRSLPPATEPAQRMTDLREIAEIQGQQSDREGMLEALRELLGIDPTDAEALALVEDDLRAHNAFDDLRAVLYAAARAPSGSAEFKRSKLREIALLSEQRMGDAPGAIDAWRALLAVAPEDDEAGTALEKLYTRAERWDDLARWVEKRASNETEPTKRRALLERLVDVHRERRQDPLGESQALRMLWEHVPADDAVAQRLLASARAVGDHGAVTEVLRARAEGSEAGNSVERWSELATHLEQTSERDESLQAWQQVTGVDPTHAAAWDAIERLLEATGRHDMLLETLVAHAEGPAAGDRGAELASRAAEIARMLGDVPTATAQARRALELAPDDEAHAALLMDLLEASDERAALVDLLRQRAERAPDGPEKIALLRRTAHTLGGSDPEAAARAWRELRAVGRRIDAGDDAEALEALCGFAEVSGDVASLAELLRESSASATDPAQRAALLHRRADLLSNELDRPDDALATLRELGDAGDATAWGKIADIAERSDKHELAAEALERQLPGIEDDEARARIASRLVAICESRLEDPSRTVTALESWYDADPTDYTVVARLAALDEKLERWADVVKYQQVLAEVEGDDAELSVMVQRIAEIAEHKLGDARRAFDVLAPVAKEGDIAALDALRGVAARGKLEDELVAMLVDLAGRVGNAADRSELWLEIARWRDEALADARGALEAYLHAVVARPAETGPLDAVDRLAGPLKEAALASQAYAAVIAATDDPATIRTLALRAVGVLEAMDGRDAALDLAVASQARAPGDDALLDAIVRLAPAIARGDEMFIAFDRRRGASRDENERYGLMLRAAESAAIDLADRDTAVSYLRLAIGQAVGGKAPDEERLGLLEATASGVDARAAALGLARAVTDVYVEVANESHEDNPRVAAVLLRRAGDLLARATGDTTAAFEMVSRAVALWPDDAASADRLERLAESMGRLAEVVELYQRVGDEAYEPHTARAYQARRAVLLGEKLGRVDAAIEALRSLVEIAPKDPEPVRRLQELLRRNGRHQDLLMALERELEMGSPSRLTVLKEIAAIWQDQLRNTFEARDAWKRVLREAPDDADARAAIERLQKRPVVQDEPTDERRVPDAVPAKGGDEVEALDAALVDDAGSRESVAPPPDPEPADARADDGEDATSAFDRATLTSVPEPATGEIDISDLRDVRDTETPHHVAAPRATVPPDEFDTDDATRVGSMDDHAPPSAPVSEPAPSVDDALEALEALDEAEAEAIEPEEAENTSDEIDAASLLDEPETTSLDSLSRLANRPTGTNASGLPPPPRNTSRPPPPPPPLRKP